MLNIGAHFSIAGGLDKALVHASKAGASCLQIFSSSPRSWQGPEVSNKEVVSFKKLKKGFKLSSLFIHAKYLVNLGSKDSAIFKKSAASLIQDMKLCSRLKGEGVVFHPKLKNFSQLIKGIKKVLTKTPKDVNLILENSAQIDLKDLAKVFKILKNKRLKLCYDTAHGFVYGCKLSSALDIIKKQIGFSFGSKHDVHADISEGKMGLLPFFVLVNHPVLKNLPFILETPGFKNKSLTSDKKNISLLRSLAEKRLKKDFFLKPTLQVAKNLLGKYLIVEKKDGLMIGEIQETEAYKGFNDKASHASKGKTKRTAPMFCKGGIFYVYLIYGMYHCLNIVTEKKGCPAAVLIRSLKPVFNIKGKTDGPGKLCRELSLTRKQNKLDITKDNSSIYIVDLNRKIKKIGRKKRVGIDYAGKWKHKKWRFKAEN